MARFVLALLLLFSLLSWAIILYKGMALHRARAQSDTFLDVFRKSQKFSEVNAVANRLPPDSSARRHVPGGLPGDRSPGPGRRPAPGAGRDPLHQKPRRGLASAGPRRLGRGVTPEKRLSFLASTTASVSAPFIGLFGTVYGIMNAFVEIGRKGAANLAIVAPGISEALITTAAGLFAAIPAALFFNYFSDRVKALSATMDDFAMEFISMVERNFT